MDLNAVFLMLVCFAIPKASVAVAAIHSSSWKPDSHIDLQHWEDGLDDDHQYLYDRMASPLTSLQRHSESDFVKNERMLQEVEFVSYMGRHEKRDLEALLSFRRAITADPQGLLSTWTARNSQNICSWYGIRCRNHSRRVVAIGLPHSGLEGTLSPSLSNLSLLRTLNLYNNTFRGRIPPVFRQLKALRQLNLGRNQLSGSLPVSIFGLPLSEIWIARNNLTGTIPGAIGNLSQLTVLYLDNNNLGGNIPEAISNLSQLTLLSLSNTSLTGNIPEAIGNLSQLTQLSLSRNHLTGSIPTSIGKLQSLGVLYLDANNLIGSIPDSFNGLVSLKRLNLSQNRLEGPIPGIGNCSFLNMFSAHSNKFSGTLPISLANCIQLQWLDLRKNGLIGEIPWYFSLFHDLRVFSIAYNNFHGIIPHYITNLTKLYVLDLSNNNLSGNIPFDLEKLLGYISPFNVGLNISYQIMYNMKGHEYSSYVLSTNTIFDLSNNHFNGDIPTSIGSMSSLRLLNLSGNQLQGPIPTSFGNISTLEQLDLSKNNLSGEIPQELSELYQLSVLNVSCNNLCGAIPRGPQLSTFSVSSFQRNKCLHGCPLDPCNGNKRPQRKGTNSGNVSKVKIGWLSQIDKKISLIALTMGLGIGFGGVIVVFILWEKANNWLIPSKKVYFGVYRFPT